MTGVLAVVTCLLLSRYGNAQGVGDEYAFAGATVATVTGAEASRVNPAGVATGRSWSARLAHFEELGNGTTPFNASTAAWATPLPFGLGVSVGATWARPDAISATTHSRLGDVYSGELGLGFSLASRITVGARLRIFGGSGAGAGSAAETVNGDAGLDLGALWRPSQWLAVGLVIRNAAGPQSPALNLERTLLGGVGLRLFGTDAVTLGLDAGWRQERGALARAGLRVALPHIGALRGDFIWDWGTDQWRGSAAVELAWERLSAGGGVFAGNGDVLGYGAQVGVDGERRATSLPERGVMVTVGLDESPGPREFGRLVLKLERLRRDPTVRGVLFAPRAGVGGLAQADELREVFAALTRAGIRVGCHLTDATGSTWMACANTARITLDPAGGVRLQGVGTTRYFLGPALWSFGVRTDFVRVGDYKSAPEMFARGSASGPSREQEAQVLDDLVGHMSEVMSSGRRVSGTEARATVLGGPYTARDAREHHLVDAIETQSTAERVFARAIGDPQRVELDDFVTQSPRRWAPGEAVAVVYVDGTITEGENRDVPVVGFHTSGERTIVEALEAAAASARVRAIVLRVDSGGGSALASDVIWRAVVAAARRKPVVASFGSIAASGGYYIAAGVREIFADKSTLTGSIGIFYGKADVAELLGRLHVGVELSRRGDRADMESLFRPYTDEERRFLAARVGEFYNLFLQRVAAGRHRSTQEIDAVGEGRVFMGERARRLGLTDREGGLWAAIQRARALGGLGEDFEVIELPSAPRGLLQTLAGMLVVAQPADFGVLSTVLRTAEVAVPLRWLLTVAAHPSQPMALSEWPEVTP